MGNFSFYEKLEAVQEYLKEKKLIDSLVKRLDWITKSCLNMKQKSG